MKRRSLSVELLEAQPAPLTIRGELYLPDQKASDTLLVCLPGGGASREYFDLGQHDGEDFSFASRMAAKGFASLAIDHPGTGENALSADYPFFNPRQSADIFASATPALCDEAGIASKQMICVGHSMGGMITVLLQARHRQFDRVALFGSSARGLDWGLSEDEKAYVGDGEALERDLEILVEKRFKAHFPPGMGGPSGKSIMFGGSSPELTQRLRDITIPLYSAGAITSMTRGAFAGEAAAIDVPILFAFGDHDIGAPPEEVPQDFGNAASIETMILAETGHNHFAFPSITTLCDRLADWAG